MAGEAGRGKLFVVQVADVVAQVADGGLEVVGESAAGDPGGVAVEVAAVGEDGVGRVAALGREVVAEGADVVGERGGGTHGCGPCRQGVVGRQRVPG